MRARSARCRPARPAASCRLLQVFQHVAQSSSAPPWPTGCARPRPRRSAGPRRTPAIRTNTSHARRAERRPPIAHGKSRGAKPRRETARADRARVPANSGIAHFAIRPVPHAARVRSRRTRGRTERTRPPCTTLTPPSGSCRRPCGGRKLALPQMYRCLAADCLPVPVDRQRVGVQEVLWQVAVVLLADVMDRTCPTRPVAHPDTVRPSVTSPPGTSSAMMTVVLSYARTTCRPGRSPHDLGKHGRVAGPVGDVGDGDPSPGPFAGERQGEDTVRAGVDLAAVRYRAAVADEPPRDPVVRRPRS